MAREHIADERTELAQRAERRAAMHGYMQVPVVGVDITADHYRRMLERFGGRSTEPFDPEYLKDRD